MLLVSGMIRATNFCYSWLYMLIVAMDANFRLKSRLQSTINKEPELGLGWAYFVNNGPYSEFIKDYVDQEEVCWVRTCILTQLTYGFVDSDLRWFSGTT